MGEVNFEKKIVAWAYFFYHDYAAVTLECGLIETIEPFDVHTTHRKNISCLKCWGDSEQRVQVNSVSEFCCEFC